ncbi:MAG TPA: nucleotidyltransferase family protein [Alphaproteobacteria bacterium]|nr:nucleotidyltransferase family protein [Alphaproteobacteria bacterium]
MRALLLAAGLGTRLRPLTDTVPKCLVPVRGRPLLDYWLDLLLEGGIERILINTHHLAEMVRSHVDASRWRDRIDLAHEDSLLGTGGTVLRNANFFGDNSFLLAHADNLTRFDIAAFIARHAARPVGVEITMMTFDTDEPRSCGIVEEDERGVVVRFHEKVAHPPGNRANAAIYILEPSVVAYIASLGRPVVDFSTEVIPAFIGRIHSFHNTSYHRDIGTIESLRKAETELRDFNEAASRHSQIASFS